MRLIDVIPIALSGTALWIFFILCIRIRKKSANAYLALLMMVIFLLIFRLITIKNETYLIERYLLFLPIFWTSSLGAISFLYLRSILYNRTKLKGFDLFFFVPLFVQIGFSTYWFIQPYKVKLDYLLTRYLPRDLGYENMLSLLCIIPLDAAAFIMTLKFTRKNWNIVTKESKPILVWARSLSIFFLIRTTGYSISISLIWIFGVGSPKTEIAQIAAIGLSLYVMWLAYYITKYPAITTGYIKFAEASQRNALFEEKLKELVEQRIYDPDLGPHPIDELSELMDVDTVYLGKYFKIHMNSNYPGYVRKLRMQRFRNLVEEAEKNGVQIQVSLLQQQCGYRSRSSFHRDVKDIFDQSPAQYIENTGSRLNPS